MSEAETRVAVDTDLEALKEARNSSAVLKLELAKLRAAIPTLAVLVFEGDDDKIVYSQWLRRAREELDYAMLPCKGKGGLLALRKAIASDKTGLSAGLYFFVDRDFDDLRGQSLNEDVFMTDHYSVENYLVTEQVAREILDIEFHCHSDPARRERILEIFRKSYDEFLQLTRQANLRLFIARRMKLEVKSLPTSIAKLASVGFESISGGTFSPEQIVCYLTDPEPDEAAALEVEFGQLEPKDRYRGKFALLFFNQWLRKLAEQAALPDRGVFNGLASKAACRTGELTLNTYASRSPLPAGFREFAAAIKGRIAA